MLLFLLFLYKYYCCHCTDFESEKRFVSLRVSAKGMRIIDKRGVEVVLAELRASGVKV